MFFHKHHRILLFPIISFGVDTFCAQDGRMNTTRNAQTVSGWFKGLKIAAAYSGLSTRTLSRWINDGRLAHRRLSKTLLMIRKQDLDRAIEEMASEYEEMNVT